MNNVLLMKPCPKHFGVSVQFPIDLNTNQARQLYPSPIGCSRRRQAQHFVGLLVVAKLMVAIDAVYVESV